MIPKIIHHCGPAEESKWNPIWKPCYDSWFRHFPEGEYTHIYWSNEAASDLVDKYYPEFKSVYDAFPVDVMRWDFSRYCIMHKYGGIYADMDLYCYKNFYSEIESYDLVLAESINELYLVENCLMASIAESKFYYDCLETSKKTYLSNVHLDVEYIKQIPQVYTSYISNMTGLNLLSNVYKWYKSDDIKVGEFDFDLFQANYLYYSDELFTKHMCTDSWNGYGTKEIDINTFDFYKNYLE